MSVPATRSRRWLRRLALGSVGAVALCTLGLLVTNVWVAASASGRLYSTVDDVPVRSVAIVPGAMVYSDGTPSLSLADRLETALELYRAGKVERILVSGDHAAPEYDETNAMRRWLVRRGVPSDDIYLDHAGLRTLDTMERAKRVFEVRDAIVCSQAYHLPRAVFLARRAGIDAVGLAADRHDYPGAASYEAREILARVGAWLDSYVLGTQPRYLGPVLPIDGDSKATHDRWTKR